jgi:hypothetical protein
MKEKITEQEFVNAMTANDISAVYLGRELVIKYGNGDKSIDKIDCLAGIELISIRNIGDYDESGRYYGSRMHMYGPEEQLWLSDTNEETWNNCVEEFPRSSKVKIQYEKEDDSKGVKYTYIMTFVQYGTDKCKLKEYIYIYK